MRCVEGEGCISCYRIMTQGSHYHGSCFLLLCLVGLVIRGHKDRWDKKTRDVVGWMSLGE